MIHQTNPQKPTDWSFEVPHEGRPAEDLRNIFHSSSQFREQAGAMLLNMGVSPPIHDARSILTSSDSQDSKRKAAEMIIKSGSNDDLLTVIEYDKRYAEQAWDILKKRNASSSHLSQVMYCAMFAKNTKMETEAWELFTQQNPSNEELEYVVSRCSPQYKTKAAAMLLTQGERE